MSSLARSFKAPPTYLSPCRRPGMPGRSFSSSSELSLSSNHDARSDDGTADVVLSAPASPALFGVEQPPVAHQGASLQPLLPPSNHLALSTLHLAASHLEHRLNFVAARTMAGAGKGQWCAMCQPELRGPTPQTLLPSMAPLLYALLFIVHLVSDELMEFADKYTPTRSSWPF